VRTTWGTGLLEEVYLVPPGGLVYKIRVKRRVLFFCGLFLTWLSGPVLLQAGSARPAPARPKIIILPARVTLDGIARPDLGQSVSDIISARLLTSAGVELLDADLPVADPVPPANASLFPTAPATGGPGTPEPSVSTLPNPGLAGPVPYHPAPAGNPAPVLSAPVAPAPVTTGIAMGADLVVQPTIVGQAEEFRLTMRQIQIPGGKIMGIITEKTSRGIKGLYALAEAHALRLVPYVPPGPRIGGGPAIIEHPARWVVTPTPAPAVSDEEIAQALPALAKLPAAKQAAIDATLRLLDPSTNAVGPSTVGRIGGLDPAWSFCTIKLKQSLELPAGTALFATAGGNPENLVNLSVTRTEGRTVIADFANSPGAAALQPGDMVYYWKP
jgi:hypothetical protein